MYEAGADNLKLIMSIKDSGVLANCSESDDVKYLIGFYCSQINNYDEKNLNKNIDKIIELVKGIDAYQTE